MKRPPGGVVPWHCWRTEMALDSRCGGNDGGRGLNDNEKALRHRLSPLRSGERRQDMVGAVKVRLELCFVARSISMMYTVKNHGGFSLIPNIVAFPVTLSLFSKPVRVSSSRLQVGNRLAEAGSGFDGRGSWLNWSPLQW